MDCFQGFQCEGVNQTQPDNLAGYWLRNPKAQESGLLIWTAELCKFASFACQTNEKCAKGHMGRQCLSCEPGYASGPGRGCFKCPPRWESVTVTTLVAGLVVLLTILLAHMVVNSAGRPQDMHAILFKQIVNHCITMTTVRQIFLSAFADLKVSSVVGKLGSNEAKHTVDDVQYGESIVELLGIFDGTFPSENYIWSMYCLAQPDWSGSHHLRDARHSEYGDNAHASSRVEFSDFQRDAEIVFMALWFSWPIVIIVVAYTVGYLKLVMNLRRRKTAYADALEFYQDIYAHTFEVAKKRHLQKEWFLFVRCYREKIWDIWWPISHAKNYVTTGRVNFTVFFEESWPIVFSVVFFAFASSARGILRPMNCQKFAVQDPVMMMKFAPEVECNMSHPLILVSMLLATCWLLIFPYLLFYLLRRARRQSKINNERPEELSRKWGLMIDGYKADRWYWEIIILLRKSACFVLETIPGSGHNRSVWFCTVAFAFITVHFIFDPYDKRSNGLLERLERFQLAVWICSAVGINLATKPVDPSLLYIIPAVLVSLHFAYLATVLAHLTMHFITNLTSKIDKRALRKQEEDEGKLGWRARFELWIVNIEERFDRKMPYVSVDHLYGWVSVLGTRGDLAELLLIPKGRAAAARRPKLSECDDRTPTYDDKKDHERAQRASEAIVVEVQRVFMDSVQHLALHLGSTFSVSWLDFVVRASFVLAREYGDRADDKDSVHEVVTDDYISAQRDRDALGLMGLHPNVGPAGAKTYSLVGAATLNEHEDHRAFKMLTHGHEIETQLRLTGAAILKTKGRRRGIQEASLALDASYGLRRVGHLGASGLAALSGATALTVGKAGKYAGKATKAVGAHKAVDFAGGLAGGFVGQATASLGSMSTKKARKSAGQRPAGDDSEESSDEDDDGVVADLVGEGTSPGVGEDEESDVKIEDDFQQHDPNEEAKRVEEALRHQFEGYVHLMFSPATFRRGVKLMEVEFALVRLQSFSRAELKVWLDVFEERWIYERVAAENSLRHIANPVVDRCEPQLVSQPLHRDRAAGQRAESTDAETQTRGDDEESEQFDPFDPAVPSDDENAPEVHAKKENKMYEAALIWLRLVTLVTRYHTDLQLSLRRKNSESNDINAMMKRLGRRQAIREVLTKQRRGVEAELSRLAQQEAELLSHHGHQGHTRHPVSDAASSASSVDEVRMHHDQDHAAVLARDVVFTSAGALPRSFVLPQPVEARLAPPGQRRPPGPSEPWPGQLAMGPEPLVRHTAGRACDKIEFRACG